MLVTRPSKSTLLTGEGSFSVKQHPPEILNTINLNGRGQCCLSNPKHKHVLYTLAVDVRAPASLLDDAFLGLQHKVTVVLPGVREVHKGGREGPEGLGVFFPQLLSHVETVHDLALPSLCSLRDAVQELHLWQRGRTVLL